MRHDAELIWPEATNWYVDWSNSLKSDLHAREPSAGYLCIPSDRLVGRGRRTDSPTYNKTVSKMTSLVSAGAGWNGGKAWAGAKGAGSAALSGG